MTRPPHYPFNVATPEVDYDALEPHIDAATRRVHCHKHHQVYVDNLNAASIDYPALHDSSIAVIVRGVADIPDAIKVAVCNQGGGHANHQLLWKILRPVGTAGAGGDHTGAFANASTRDFGSLENPKARVNSPGMNVFGSGWVFFVADPASLRLKIRSTANQDRVLLDNGMAALFACDVWENAYFRNYKNERAAYLAAFWNILAWAVVEDRYEGVRAGEKHL